MTTLKEQHQRPEGALIEAALNQAVPKVSQRELARRVGMSEGRIRQILNGYQSQGGVVFPIIGPPDTVARMAVAAGLTPAQMREVGRDDVADAMRPTMAPEGRTIPLTRQQSDYLSGVILLLGDIAAVPELEGEARRVEQDFRILLRRYVAYVDALMGGDGNGEDRAAPMTAADSELSAADDELPAAAKEGVIEESGEFNT